MNFKHFLNCKSYFYQARLGAIWRKLPAQISDSERNFKLGLQMLFLQTLESKPVAKPRIAKVHPQCPEALVRIKKEFDKFREYGFVIEGSSTWSASSSEIKNEIGESRIVIIFAISTRSSFQLRFTPRVVEPEPKQLWMVESEPEICVPVPQTYFVKESELYKCYNGF